MNWKTRLVLRESVFTAITFTAAAYSYYIFSFWGVQDHFNDWPLQEYLTSHLVHVELLMVGILFGILIAVINRITDTPKLRKRPVIQIVIYRTILYLISFIIVSILVLTVFVILIYPWEVMSGMFYAMSPRYTMSFVIWLILVVAGINMALEIERIVGPGNIWRLLIGRYRQPNEEERIFLFMDLKESTTIAEGLGHMRYSELIQECYHDLTQVVMQYEAVIYQYVGDEVVMSWPFSKKETLAIKSVQAFFAYQSLLKQKEQVYKSRFGLVPEFRGGIDMGAVTIIEVGDVKREIVYHGDVLNTAARLLELCKTRDEKVVVSDTIGESIKQDASFEINWIEKVSLRGKKIPVGAYSIQSIHG
ncbi:MAG: hypothetical protein KAI99_04880 [Cyclobacteriaceae bacterium]|nr:hypothetical protein [Cyclobacteriaceae bacterium]